MSDKSPIIGSRGFRDALVKALPHSLPVAEDEADTIIASLVRDISSDPVDGPTFGHCYVPYEFAGCGFDYGDGTTCGGLFTDHEREHHVEKRDISSVTGNEQRPTVTHTVEYLERRIESAKREAVDAFIRDELPGLYDRAMTSPWDADLDGEAIAAKIAELYSARP